MAETNNNEASQNVVAQKEMKCPVCNKNFTQTYVRKLKLRLIKSDIDLRGYYEPVDPLYYDVVICPNCGYCADCIFFDNIIRHKKDLILKGITPTYIHKEYKVPHTADDALEMYRYAFLNAQVKDAKDSEIAYIHLKMAWIYRDLGDKMNENRQLSLCIAGFEKAYVHEDVPICGMDNFTIRYLIGAIYYLLDNPDATLRWIADVIVSKTAQSRLRDRAIDLKNDILNAQANQK